MYQIYEEKEEIVRWFVSHNENDMEGARKVYLHHSVQSKGSYESPSGCHAVRRQELVGCDWRSSGAVRVVDDCVERLVGPLPEDDSGSTSVESHHRSSDTHITWHLGRHATNQDHFF